MRSFLRLILGGGGQTHASQGKEKGVPAFMDGCGVMVTFSSASFSLHQVGTL